jgi:hypothetical protein
MTNNPLETPRWKRTPKLAVLTAEEVAFGAVVTTLPPGLAPRAAPAGGED